MKASAGAVEHLLLVPVDDLAGALTDLHVRGLRVAGAEAEAPMTARDSDLRGPLVLVVGSEGQGLGPTVRRRCDLVVRIPMRGAIGSLNAAVAGSVLLFEAVAQRDPDGSASAPAAASPAAAPAPRPRRPSWDDPGDPPADATAETAVSLAGAEVTAEPVPSPIAEPAAPKRASRSKAAAIGEPALEPAPTPVKRPRSKAAAIPEPGSVLPPGPVPAAKPARAARTRVAATADPAPAKRVRRAKPASAGGVGPENTGSDEDADLLPD